MNLVIHIVGYWLAACGALVALWVAFVEIGRWFVNWRVRNYYRSRVGR